MMPLLNQKPWFPTSLKPPDGVKDTDKVFHLRQTGEIFDSYESYLSRVRLLQSKQWSAGGKDGLNYEQALVEEQRAQELSNQFPKELEEAALGVVHHSVLPLEELVEEVHCRISSPSGTSDKENATGQKPAKAAPSKTAFSHDSIRSWIASVAQTEAHGTWKVWIAKPEYQRKFRLAAQLPKEIAEALKKNTDQPAANGSEKAAGQSSPKKSASKRKASDAGSPDAAPASGSKAKKKKKPSPAEGEGTKNAKYEEEAWVPPPVVPIEVEEKQLKAGTHKAAAFHALKEAGVGGLSMADIMSAATQRGIRQYDGTDGQKKVLSYTVTSDPCFVRVKKGIYALRALMGDAPFEAVCRPPKKASKDSATVPTGTTVPTGNKEKAQGKAKGTQGSPQGKSPAKAAAAKPLSPRPVEKLAEPAVEEPYVPPPVRSIEEEEQRIKPGTNKAVIFAVLKQVGAKGMSVADIMRAAAQQGLREFTDNQKGAVSAALTTDPAFVRVTKGIYAVRALMGDAPYEAVGKPSKKGQPKGNLQLIPGLAGLPSSSTDQEAQSLTKNAQVELEVRKSLEARRAALQKAMSQQQKAQARLEKAAQEPRTPSQRVHEDALGSPPSFELTHEEKRFSGDPGNKADVAAYKQRIATLQAHNDAARREWLARLAEAREKDGGGTSELAKAQRALKSAQKRVSAARAEVAAVEQTYWEAAKAASKEMSKKATEEKRAEEKRQREAARAAEKERKREEALEAKRYPMEDLQLLDELKQKAAAQGLEAPAEDVPLPEEWLPREDGDATADLLFVADFSSQFAKVLKVKPPTYQDLVGLLESGEPGSADLAESLWDLYEGLVKLVLQESAEGSKQRGWAALLSKGTLGEVLRRFLEARQEAASNDDSPALATAAEELSSKPLDALSGQQHRRLLCFLCDQLLDGEKLRQALQDRLDESGDVKREMREAVAEKKGELKEILEAEREEQRKKREEEKAAKKAKEDAAKKAREAAANCSAPQEGEPAAAETQLPTAAGAAGEGGGDVIMEEEEEEEPSWELPPELQEFQGDSSDRKLLLAFRQKQQAARQKLEKAKEKWHKAARQRAKEREARQRAVTEAEKAKARAKAAAEEEVLRQQEAYDRELEKLLVRRAPLGLDRHHRRYWYGVAGQRSLLYVEDADGKWGALRTPEQLDALLAALDKRGVRESALHAALEKVQSALAQAMKKAQAEAKREAPAGAEQTRFPKRERTQAVLFNVTTLAAAQPNNDSATASTAGIDGLEGEALSHASAVLSDLQKEMAGRSVGPPEDGWKAWSQTFQQAGKIARAALEKEGSLAGFVASLKTCLVEAEDMLFEAAGAAETDSNSSSDAEEQQEWGSEGGKRKAGRLWRDAAERDAWRDCLMEAETLAAVAFSTASLGQRGMRLLERMERPKPAGKARKESRPQGKAENKQEAKPAAKPAKPAAAAARPAGPRPPTRANPQRVASLEELTKPGKGAAGKDKGKEAKRSSKPEAKAAPKAKKQAAEKRKGQEPPVQRVTRARVQ